MERTKPEATKQPNDELEADRPNKSGKPVFLLFDGDVTGESIMAAIEGYRKKKNEKNTDLSR
jgi:predicted phosphoribosyltransferase